MSSQKRIKLIIHGKVQGVGYRFSVKRKADSLGIMGYVKNLHDGSVFTTAQGNILALNNFKLDHGKTKFFDKNAINPLHNWP